MATLQLIFVVLLIVSQTFAVDSSSVSDPSGGQATGVKTPGGAAGAQPAPPASGPTSPLSGLPVAGSVLGGVTGGGGGGSVGGVLGR